MRHHGPPVTPPSGCGSPRRSPPFRPAPSATCRPPARLRPPTAAAPGAPGPRHPPAASLARGSAATLGARARPGRRALAGAWLGLLVVGSVRAPVGPDGHEDGAAPVPRPAARRSTSPPLGTLELDSHHAPLRLDVDVDQLDPARSAALVDHPERISRAGGRDHPRRAHGRRGARPAGRVAVVAGATALGARRLPPPGPRPGGGRSRAGAAGRRRARRRTRPGTRSPSWSRSSPDCSPARRRVVGNARSIVNDFGVYQQELARLVTNVTKLYEATSTLPAYQPDPDDQRVLHVSDIHLNPAAWQHHQVARQAVRHRRDHRHRRHDGPRHRRRERLPRPVPDLGAPYVWVRGNHDSRDHAEGDAKLARARPRARRRRAVDGRRRCGSRASATRSSPRTAPSRRGATRRSAPDGRQPPRPARAEGRRHAGRHRRGPQPGGRPQTDGLVPLALAGHTHHRRTTMLQQGTRLMVEGTTGGGGLRAVEDEQPADRSQPPCSTWTGNGPPPGLGRDHAGRSGAGDGRGQPAPRRREHRPGRRASLRRTSAVRRAVHAPPAASAGPLARSRAPPARAR